jgi:hypothetical protein
VDAESRHLPFMVNDENDGEGKMETRKKIMVVLVLIIVVSFFLPWISVESQAIGGVTKLLTGKEQAAIDSISGFKVPILANGDESRFMISVIKIFRPDIKNADKKSFLIWCIPLLAVIMLGLTNALKDNKWVRLAIGIIGVVIFAFATFKITTTDLDKLVLNVKIGYGLWLILIGYLGIGMLQFIEFFQLKKTNKQ